MKVLRDWTLDFGVDDVLRSQGADPAAIRRRSGRLVDLTEQALEEGRELLDPVVAIGEFAVTRSLHNRVELEGGGRLSGPLVATELGRADSVAVMLCTVGAELGATAARLSERRLSYAFALDAVGSAAVHSLSAAACNRVERDALSGELQTGLPLSPGMIGWGVDPGQREIFSLIDAAAVGVELSPTLEMLPLKSLTAVVGIGPDMTSDGSVCDHCDLRDTCRQRVA